MRIASQVLFQVSEATKHKQRGNGLLYALLGAALLAAGSYFAFGIYQDKQMDASIEADITNIQDTVQMTQRLFGQRDDYAGQNTATLIQSGAIPPRLRVAGTDTAINAFGQSITVAGPGTFSNPNDAMGFRWLVPKAACMQIITAMAKIARIIYITNTGNPGQPVKGGDNIFETNYAAANCDINSVTEITFYVGRFPSSNN